MVDSDHHPIVVKLQVDYGRHRVRPFRYEVAWKLHEEFDEFIRSTWKGLEDLNGISNLQKELLRWNSIVFGRIKHRKGRLLNRLNGEGVRG
ncbi:hypothetical protein K1719_005363 [Acacia pycnantha]|nr:hypothetical protein K1719_005363 [Acacia pycnantha]